MSFLEKHAQFFLGTSAIAALAAAVSSCGDELDKRSIRPYLSSDSQVKQTLTIQMPELSDLSEGKELLSLIDYQYVRVTSEGNNCNQRLDEVFQKEFQDAQKFTIEADYRCDYQIEIIIGQKDKLLALNNETGKIYYDRDIWPIIESSCLSCHADFAEQVSEEQITFQVINQLMPPESNLEKQDIAKFIAWQVFDYPKQAPASNDTQASELGFSKIFYRSSESVKIKSFEFLTKNQVELETILWLQQDGKDAGFSSQAWSIKKPTKK